jgi:hypothetical protein
VCPLARSQRVLPIGLTVVQVATTGLS